METTNGIVSLLVRVNVERGEEVRVYLQHWLILRSFSSLGSVGDGSRLAAVLISLTFTSGQAGRIDRHTETTQTDLNNLIGDAFCKNTQFYFKLQNPFLWRKLNRVIVIDLRFVPAYSQLVSIFFFRNMRTKPIWHLSLSPSRYHVLFWIIGTQSQWPYKTSIH